jgi:hypothetical protein
VICKVTVLREDHKAEVVSVDQENHVPISLRTRKSPMDILEDSSHEALSPMCQTPLPCPLAPVLKAHPATHTLVGSHSQRQVHSSRP